MKVVVVWLRLFSALSAFCAAGLWLASAWEVGGVEKTGSGYILQFDEFTRGLENSARWNRNAAIAAAVAAVLAGIAELATARTAAGLVETVGNWQRDGEQQTENDNGR